MSDVSSSGATCDRCRTAAAHWRYTKGELELLWCDHHDRQLILRLIADGWTRRSLAMPNLPSVGASPIPR